MWPIHLPTPIESSRPKSQMNGRVTSTYWLPSLSKKTVSSGEIALNILKISRYKHRTEVSEGDSDSVHQGRMTGETKNMTYSRSSSE